MRRRSGESIVGEARTSGATSRAMIHWSTARCAVSASMSVVARCDAVRVTHRAECARVPSVGRRSVHASSFASDVMQATVVEHGDPAALTRARSGDDGLVEVQIPRLATLAGMHSGFATLARDAASVATFARDEAPAIATGEQAMDLAPQLGDGERRTPIVAVAGRHRQLRVCHACALSAGSTSSPRPIVRSACASLSRSRASARSSSAERARAAP